jgi:hypothetical protein
MTPRRDSRRLVPPYLATAGRAEPTRNTLDRLSLISAAYDAPLPAGLDPPKRRVVELIRGGPLSLSEIAAYVRLPVSVVRVLVSDLVDAGHLQARAPIPAAVPQNQTLLEKVLSGLRAIR